MQLSEMQGVGKVNNWSLFQPCSIVLRKSGWLMFARFQSAAI